MIRLTSSWALVQGDGPPRILTWIKFRATGGTLKRTLVTCAVAAALALCGCSGPQISDVDPPKSELSSAELKTWAENKFILAGISTENLNAQTYPKVVCEYLWDEQSVSDVVAEFAKIKNITDEQAQTIVAVGIRGRCPQYTQQWDEYRSS